MDGVDYQTERKLEVNRWIIKSRWFYMLGILLIGVLTKVISKSNLHFSFLEMLLILVAFAIFNIIVYFVFNLIAKQKESGGKVNPYLFFFLGIFQIVFELLTFVYVMHKAGGVESISGVFFFLTIVSASLLFGLAGSILTALAAGALVNGLILAEYYNYIPHISRYEQNTYEFLSLSISLTKTITTAVFYFIIGLFSGFGAKLLFKRERLLTEQSKKLSEDSTLREEQLKKLDQTTKLLVSQEKELSDKNWVLDAKINELEGSKKSLLEALEEVKVAKMKTEEEKNKTLAIISNFTDPILVLDKEQRLSLFNMAAQITLGLKSSDLGSEIPIKDGDFSLDHFREIIRRDFDFKKIKTEKENDLLTEEMHIEEEGNELTYKVITVNVRDSWGNNTGVMKIFYDFTREKIIDKMKSDFISIAAHQLRTPLSAIKWSTGMLINGDAGPLNEEQKNFLHKSYISNEAMINLVNDLLNVSRIEEGRFGYIFKYLTLQEVIDTVINNTKPQIDKSGVAVKINNEDKHIQVCIDKDKMVLALQNLFENALKYTPRYGTIEISVKKREEGYISISIKDSGIGIPKKEQGKVFSKFFRASNVLLMESEGTGLGLFIVKNVVDKHSGKISLFSEEGKGTEVTIKLPIECKTE